MQVAPIAVKGLVRQKLWENHALRGSPATGCLELAHSATLLVATRLQ